MIFGLPKFHRTDIVRRDVCIAKEHTEGTNSKTFIINDGRSYQGDLFLVKTFKQGERDELFRDNIHYRFAWHIQK